jgi:hypothetical protein
MHAPRGARGDLSSLEGPGEGKTKTWLPLGILAR